MRVFFSYVFIKGSLIKYQYKEDYYTTYVFCNKIQKFMFVMCV